MNRLYYPLPSLLPDYLRAGIGLIFSIGLLLFASPQSVIFVLLAGSSLLFAWLAVSTVWRQQIEIELGPSGMTQTTRWRFGRSRVMPWTELTAVSLRYFSTRRDRSQGWLQLTIRGCWGKVRVDSGLTGFAYLVQQAIAAADRAGVPVSDSTRANAARIGVQPLSMEERL